MSIQTPEELMRLREAGRVVRETLAAMRRQAREGVTTAELDNAGIEVMRRNGARSAPAMVYGFPGASCISVNEEAVHGIPSKRTLRGGDLLKLDVTIEKDGFMADAAVTVPIGKVSPRKQELAQCAKRAFDEAILVARAGVRVSEIGRVVEREVRRSGFSVMRELAGHGIGRSIHEAPSIPNYADPEADEILTEGLVITIEPIIAAGNGRSVLEQDGWTIRTADRQPSAHYEHTIVITQGQPILLTAA